MFVFGEICCCFFTQETIAKNLVLIFFGWRLCCGRVRVSRSSQVSSRTLTHGYSLYHSVTNLHQYVDTEPRLKPPVAWTVLFVFSSSYLYPKFAGFVTVKRQAKLSSPQMLHFLLVFCSST